MLGFTSHPLFIVAVLCANIALVEWLVRRTFLRHVGTALLVILATALTANLGVIPAARNPVYDGIFAYVAPLAIFLPLLQVNLKRVARAGGAMLAAFGTASLGTFVAVPVAGWLTGLREAVGTTLYGPLGGMFVGTYTGGSVNFNALALHYGVVERGNLYAGAVAVDNIITTLWMVVTIALPRWLGRREPAASIASSQSGAPAPRDRATVGPLELGVLLGLGAAAIWLSEGLAGWAAMAGISIPSVLFLTTLALLLAQLRAVTGMKAVQPLGMFSVYLFLAVIGAYCDLSALGGMGSLGLTLLVFAVLAVSMHGAAAFSLGRLFSRDWALLAIASQANIGGPTSALALARSLDRDDLLLPAILVGSLGYALGTYLGFLAAEYVLA